MRLLQVKRHPSNPDEVAIAVTPSINPKLQTPGHPQVVRTFAQASNDGVWHETTPKGAKLSQGAVYPTRKGLGYTLEALYQAYQLAERDAHAQPQQQAGNVPHPAGPPMQSQLPAPQSQQQKGPPGGTGSGALNVGVFLEIATGGAGAGKGGSLKHTGEPVPSFSIELNPSAPPPVVLPSAGPGSLAPAPLLPAAPAVSAAEIQADCDVFENDLADLEAHLNTSRAIGGGL